MINPPAFKDSFLVADPAVKLALKKALLQVAEAAAFEGEELDAARLREMAGSIGNLADVTLSLHSQPWLRPRKNV